MMKPMLVEEPEYILELEGLSQTLYDPASGETFMVKVDQRLQIRPRSVVALLGPSGCGKTTLLSVLGLLRSPTQVDSLKDFVIRTCNLARENEIGNWTEHNLKDIWKRRKKTRVEKLRRQHIGFALQSGELLPSLTVRENIAVPLSLNGHSRVDIRQRVDDLLDSFGLEDDQPDKNAGSGRRHLGQHRINRLSGGEYQRVALARAVAHKPMLLFVDEPTSALNRELAHDALRQLRSLQTNPNSHGALVMITHDEQLAKTFADLIVRMAPRKGEPVGEVVNISTHEPLLSFEMPNQTLSPAGIEYGSPVNQSASATNESAAGPASIKPPQN